MTRPQFSRQWGLPMSSKTYRAIAILLPVVEKFNEVSIRVGFPDRIDLDG
jgi:hypothetical protein